jgi:hypothetical protein
MRSLAIVTLCVCAIFSTATARADSTVPEPPRGDRWETRYDFDGDGKLDRVEVSYTGGGHCCYLFQLRLSSRKRPIELPFLLDGGYPFGLNLSRPEHFDVRDVDGDGASDLVMEIGTYGGRNEPIPVEWKRLGVRSHRVVVHFPRGRMRVENRRK